MISLIAALDLNFLIGNNNKLPWHYPKDLLFFKQKTFNQNVLMGFNTYQSLKQYYKTKPFPFCNIYVASLSHNIHSPNVIVIKDLITFLEEYKLQNEDIIIIGGSQIYKQSLPYVDEMYLTHILKEYQGDVFFPRFKKEEFLIKEKQIVDEMIFATYVRKSNKNKG